MKITTINGKSDGQEWKDQRKTIATNKENYWNNKENDVASDYEGITHEDITYLNTKTNQNTTPAQKHDEKRMTS